MSQANPKSLSPRACQPGITRGPWVNGGLLPLLLGSLARQDSMMDQSCTSLSQACELLLSRVSPAFGPMAGGIVLALTGQSFAVGATVSIDGVVAT